MSALIGLLARQDERAFRVVVSCRIGVVDRVMRLITHLGGASATIGASVLLSVGAVPGLQSVGGEALFLLVFSHLGVQLLKRGVSRPRPRLPIGSESMIRAPDRFSFPSGHAAAALSVAIPLASAAPLFLQPIPLGIAALVGLSRCYLGVHYPGDVIAGWLLVVLAQWVAVLGLV